MAAPLSPSRRTALDGWHNVAVALRRHAASRLMAAGSAARTLPRVLARAAAARRAAARCSIGGSAGKTLRFAQARGIMARVFISRGAKSSWRYHLSVTHAHTAPHAGPRTPLFLFTLFAPRAPLSASPHSQTPLRSRAMRVSAHRFRLFARTSPGSYSGSHVLRFGPLFVPGVPVQFCSTARTDLPDRTRTSRLARHRWIARAANRASLALPPLLRLKRLSLAHRAPLLRCARIARHRAGSHRAPLLTAARCAQRVTHRRSAHVALPAPRIASRAASWFCTRRACRTHRRRSAAALFTHTLRTHIPSPLLRTHYATHSSLPPPLHCTHHCHPASRLPACHWFCAVCTAHAHLVACTAASRTLHCARASSIAAPRTTPLPLAARTHAAPRTAAVNAHASAHLAVPRAAARLCASFPHSRTSPRTCESDGGRAALTACHTLRMRTASRLRAHRVSMPHTRIAHASRAARHHRLPSRLFGTLATCALLHAARVARTPHALPSRLHCPAPRCVAYPRCRALRVTRAAARVARHIIASRGTYCLHGYWRSERAAPFFVRLGSRHSTPHVRARQTRQRYRHKHRRPRLPRYLAALSATARSESSGIALHAYAHIGRLASTHPAA